MDPASLTYYGGVVVGAIMFAVICYSYVKNKKLDAGGIALAIVALALFVLSISKTLDIDVSKGLFRVAMWDRTPGKPTVATDIALSTVAPARYRVEVVNESSFVGDEEIRAATAVLQKQVSGDLAPAWGVDANLSFVPKGQQPRSDSWKLLILDEFDQSLALGYHDISEDGLPVGKVFAKTTRDNGDDWTIVASHELLNMLIDPRANQTILVSSGDANLLYALEIADPCQDDASGYRIDGVLVSDFVFPRWFEPGVKGVTPLDFRKHLSRPLQLCKSGYALTMDLKSVSWKTTLAP